MSDSQRPMTVWCCGGGTQSAAIAVSILRGLLPKPDLAIITDTGRERTATWEYFDKVLWPAMDSFGLDVVRVKSSDFTLVKLLGAKGPILPGWTTQSGERGKLSNYCSGTWKRDVIERWLRRDMKVKSCVLWFGMSLEEMRRVRRPHRGWIQHHYPLIFDLRYNRAAAIEAVTSFGWPTPPRSACWMCPNAGDKEWLDMKENWPEDFAAAVQLEREVRDSDRHFYLHSQCVPLDQVIFEKEQATAGGCSTQFCFT